VAYGHLKLKEKKVSLEFNVYLIALGSTQPPTQMSTRSISWG